MAIYQDVSIYEDDLKLDGDGQAAIICDIDVIAQDLIHAIRESGYLVEMVAERSPERRQLLMQKIILLVEDDERIIPGTVEITASPDNFSGFQGRWTLKAETYEFGETGTIELAAN